MQPAAADMQTHAEPYECSLVPRLRWGVWKMLPMSLGGEKSGERD